MMSDDNAALMDARKGMWSKSPIEGEFTVIQALSLWHQLKSRQSRPFKERKSADLFDRVFGINPKAHESLVAFFQQGIQGVRF